MNADALLATFSKMGDEPDRILQLRKIAVALAITGRLNGEFVAMTPSEMVGAMELAKARLVKHGALAKQKKFDAVVEEQLPENFSDPSHFIPLGAVARIEKGQTGIQQASPGPFPLVVTSPERGSCDHYDFDGRAAIIPLVSSTGHGNASINRLHYQEGKFALGTILAAVFPHDASLISARFIFEYLSAFKDELLVTRMTGTANVTLSVGRIAEVPVPLVSPDVQAKVDELMALCDRLEAARTEREAARDRLTAASLARLNAPDPDPATFTTHARFALDNLAPLTARTDQIKHLRQTILNLAVRGKLVEQDAADEPAAELLKYVAKNFAKLVGDGKINKQKPIKPVQNSDALFAIPDGWTFARFNQVAAIQSNLVDPAKFKHMPHIAPDNIESWTARLLPYKSIVNSGVFSSKHRFSSGVILYSKIRPNLAKVVKVDFEGLCSADMYPIYPLIDRDYLSNFMITPHFVAQAVIEDNRVAMPKINQSALSDILVPLPPLAEQHRIVAKVHELMALCDRLEATIATTDQTRRRLLEALLHEALAPQAARELEPA